MPSSGIAGANLANILAHHTSYRLADGCLGWVRSGRNSDTKVNSAQVKLNLPTGAELGKNRKITRNPDRRKFVFNKMKSNKLLLLLCPHHLRQVTLLCQSQAKLG